MYEFAKAMSDCGIFGFHFNFIVLSQTTNSFSSTTKAKFRSVADTTSAIEWIIIVPAELKIKILDPIIIWCDNSGVIAL